MTRIYRIGDFYRNKHTQGVCQIVGDGGPVGDGPDEAFVYNGVFNDEGYWLTVGPPSVPEMAQMWVDAQPETDLDSHWEPCERPDGWPL